MKKALDKLINNIKFDKKYVLFSLIIVILGIITGAIFIVILNSADKAIVVEYIESFIEHLRLDNFKYIDNLKNTLIINFSIIFIISLIGFTYFFFPINIIILFYKAFIIGFSISSFIFTYKLKGLVLSIIYIFPHLIINILLISILTAFTTKLSMNMINNIAKKKQVNMRNYTNKYLHVVFFFTILVLLTSLYESFASPFLLKLVIKILIH